MEETVEYESIEENITANLGEAQSRQSKRTTFKLTKEASEAMDWLANFYKLSLKDIFDKICSTKFINAIAPHTNKTTETRQQFIRRTFVISKKALSELNGAAKRYKIPRDVLVTELALYFRLLLENALEEQLKNHEKAHEILKDFSEKAGNVEKQLNELLGDNDPIPHRFGYVMVIIDNLEGDVSAELRDGTPIDPDTY